MGGEQKLNFIMKVKGHYRTALARQVAEAVWIEGQTEGAVGMDTNVLTAVERGGVDVGSCS